MRCPSGPSQRINLGRNIRNARMSCGTSKLPVGTGQKQCASELDSRQVNPIGGAGLIDAKWMDDRHNAESSQSRQKIGKCGSKQVNSKFGNGHRSASVCQYYKTFRA